MHDHTQRLEIAPDTDKRAGLSRRQLVKAGAWAAPVVVLAAAVPAAAASTPVENKSVTVSSITAPVPSHGIPLVTGLYTDITVKVRNNGNTAVTVSVALTQTNGQWTTVTVRNGTAYALVINPGAEATYDQFARFNPGSNGSLTATATVTVPSTGWSGGLALTATTTNLGPINKVAA